MSAQNSDTPKVEGSIGVTTDNIFPIIKKFLYSDHEIFLRELVANAVDATQKLKALAAAGEVSEEIGTPSITVTSDPKLGTITVSDSGIGMTQEEVEKYINQIAFSSAGAFLEKYKDQLTNMIGHFGLGFYSSFMVSSKVELITKSYHTEAPAVKWSCEGDPRYTMEFVEKEGRGTQVVLYLDDESKSFAEPAKVRELLQKYCRFLPVEILFEEKPINETQPLWTRKPSELKEEEYIEFYRKLYPMQEEPLFYIHLNVDYPFNLTGILYFPKIKDRLDISRNKIQLYCNQVFVTDSVEGIVPEFLTLLHGVLDSPDIPLNVSRSFLQSDQNVKKISTHITKKVADRLEEIFKSDRPQFEEKWESLKLFIQYGMLSDEKFYERAIKFALMKDVDGACFTQDEYLKLIKDNQTDKDGSIIYLYTTNKNDQYSYIQAAQDKGYSILVMDGQLDVHVISHLEQKLEKTRFVRVDSDTIDKLIRKEESHSIQLDENQQNALREIFKSQLPVMEKMDFNVVCEAQSEQANPVMLTQSEYMRRMREMSFMQPGMSFYGEMPDSYNVVLNTDHPLVKNILADEETNCADSLRPIQADIKGWETRQADLRAAQNKKKTDEITETEKEDLTNTNKTLDELRDRQKAILSEYAANNPIISQLIDLALLGNGLLKGEALSRFIKRSVGIMNG